jgi:hypothetical protein
MKKSVLILLVLFLCVSVANAQRAKIEIKAVTPGMLASNSAFTQDSTVATGLKTVANKIWCYVNVVNIDGSAAITGATWTILTKPSGSNAAISPIGSIHWWAKFRPDVVGAYVIKVTMSTSAGSHDTTTTIYSGEFVGTGGFDGIAPVYPNCMLCHQGMPRFAAIFNRWKVSGHANFFRINIDSGSAGYGVNCFPCHTTGYNHNLKVNNHGFDDVAATLGWVWVGPPHAGKWDSLKTNFPSLVAFASIGCENCHGPGGGNHALNGDTNMISISYNAGLCGQCHDSPPHHSIYAQWTNALHSHVVWSSSFAQNSGAPGFEFNGLGNCIRCHDGRGYVNFTKGIGTNTVGMIQASQEMISCQACHDPHGNANDHWLRHMASSSDTLANGYHYNAGYGNTCLDCHKNRTDNAVTVQTRVNSSHWGPHHSVQGDILFGQNAASFGFPYISGSHRNISNLCIQCHMAPTADTGTPSWNKVGEHSFNMADEENNYDNVNGCLGCHPGVTGFDDFMAPEDYDGNNQIQSWEDEMNGCIRNMRIALPPTGIDSVAWQLVAADSFNVDLRKAYWNYLLLSNDGSHGLHNPFFYVSVYQQTMPHLPPIGVRITNGEIPKVFSLSQNYPNPFNPTTKINFTLPKQENVSIKIYDIMGREVYTLVNMKMTPGEYEAIWTSINNDGKSVASGVYFYRIVAGSFVESKKMILVR